MRADLLLPTGNVTAAPETRKPGSMLRALAKAPGDRFATMEQLVPQLEPYAGASGQMSALVGSGRTRDRARCRARRS